MGTYQETAPRCNQVQSPQGCKQRGWASSLQPSCTHSPYPALSPDPQIPISQPYLFPPKPATPVHPSPCTLVRHPACAPCTSQPEHLSNRAPIMPVQPCPPLSRAFLHSSARRPPIPAPRPRRSSPAPCRARPPLRSPSSASARRARDVKRALARVGRGRDFRIGTFPEASSGIRAATEALTFAPEVLPEEAPRTRRPGELTSGASTPRDPLLPGVARATVYGVFEGQTCARRSHAARGTM